MDISKKCERATNPFERASILSKVTFWYTISTYRKGLQKTLYEKDIYKPIDEFNSTALGNALGGKWKTKKKILPCLLRIFGPKYLAFLIIFVLSHTALRLAMFLLKRRLISYFTPDQTNTIQAEAACNAAVLGASMFLNSVVVHYSVFCVQQIALKIKISICSLIYRKYLRICTSTKAATGYAVTLISKDVDIFDQLTIHLLVAFSGFLQTVLLMLYMYMHVGESALIGASVFVVFILIFVYVGKKISMFRLQTAVYTDQRLKQSNEILAAIRIVKMYTWEPFFSNVLYILRKKEVKSLRYLYYSRAISKALGQLSFRLAFYLCIMSHALLGNNVTAEKAFVIMMCFTTSQHFLNNFLPKVMAALSEMKTVLERIDKFLLQQEVEETLKQKSDEKFKPSISIENVTFMLHDGNSGSFNNLQIRPGLTLIIGPVASGKSTLLKLILGDVAKTNGDLQVTGTVSYASQEPWLFPATIRQNIIFDNPFDRERYSRVVKVCALEKDLLDLPAGDDTFVLDRGHNLSQGQKARVNLARAVYRKADIYLLDDPLSAVDPQVGHKIFFECIKGFLKEKLCLLVIHQEQYLEEADDIIVLGESLNKIDHARLTNENCVQTEVDEKHNSTDAFCDSQYKIKDDIKEQQETAKLIDNVYEENVKEGAVKMQVYLSYFKSGGGAKMLVFIVIVCFVTQAASSWSDYLSSVWIDTEQQLSMCKINQIINSTECKRWKELHRSNLIRFSFAILGVTLLDICRSFLLYIFSSKASNSLHKIVSGKIFNAALAFFDKSLSGNAINKLSRDLGILDEQIPNTLVEIVTESATIGGVFFIVTFTKPALVMPLLVLLAVLYLLYKLYISSARSIRRLEGTTQSPIVGQFNTTFEGLNTIRASQAEPALQSRLERHLDLHYSVVHTKVALLSGFRFFVDITRDIFVTLVATIVVVFKSNVSAGTMGLSLTLLFSLCGGLHWVMSQISELENEMTSVERVLEYTSVEAENKSGNKVTDWPSTGKIVYKGVNLQYATVSQTLKDVNFVIHPKQKIGLVGRTGAGKSSIISVLFRLYDFEGVISIDGVDINSVAVELLRSKISVIPQDPTIFSGTVRTNLDPFGKFSDQQLWGALELVKMKGAISGLDVDLDKDGPSFSLGQKQLICLARAVLQDNRILVLDEATANVDPLTDSMIQEVIETKFCDCTVITVAHRLSTVLKSDKIFVVDSGRIVEEGHPKALLENQNSTFYKMVNRRSSTK